MAPSTQLHADDAWFDLVPVALIEFNEHGRVMRANSALSALLGYATPAGHKLADCAQALQRLCGWDAPLTLLALGPEDSPLQCQVPQSRQGQSPTILCSQIWTYAQAQSEQPRRFLCAIRESLSAQPGASPNITSDADAAPVPGQAQLLHELSTILESTPSGIAYLRDDVLVRCNRRFERMLGLEPGSMVGQKLSELLAVDPRIERAVTESAIEVRLHGQFETELEIVVPGHTTRWYDLSVRRIGTAVEPLELIAVLTDITRIRTQQSELEALGRDRSLMFSLSGIGIAFVRDGHIQSANPALSDLIGESDTDLAGRPLSGLYASDTDPHTDADITSMLRILSHWQGERALRVTPTGQALWTEVAMRLVNPMQPEDGFIASFVNVDDRRRAELNLTLQADRTRAILDSVFVGIVTLDAQGIAWMNRSARRMFAGDLADFVAQPLSTVATPDLDHPFRLTDYLDELQDGQSHTFECQVMGRDGRVFWVVGNAVVTLDELGQRQATYALLDIDRRRQAEADSAEAQATLQRIIMMAPMAIQLIDAHELTLLQANEASVAFLGTDVAKALERNPEGIYPSDRARLIRADMQSALDHSKPLHREHSVPGRNGLHIWDINYLPLAAEGEVADQLLLVASDITEQRAAEQARLEAAIAQREMLVREVHHRIKNNLQGVAGLLQQIAARKPEVAPAISEVVGQVQAIAQVYGLQVGTGGPLRLKAVIEAIALSVQRTFGRAIQLAVDGAMAGDWQLPEAESIPIALSLNELLTNAHKHSPGTQALQCWMSASEQGVRIDIRSPGRLPEGFSMDRVPGGVSGLGLVRALLPRRSAKLSLFQDGTDVLTRIELTPPGITLLPPTPLSTGEPAGHQIALWPQ
jgi:PAS domain S-box-containing protein